MSDDKQITDDREITNGHLEVGDLLDRPPPPPPYLDDHEPYEEAEDEPEPDLGPRRTDKLARKRKKQRLAQWVFGTAAVIALVIGIIGVITRIEPRDEDRVAKTSPAAPAEPEAVSTLIFGSREADPADGAIWMALLSYDPTEEKGSIVYIPTHTAVEVPGHGLLGVGEAYGGRGNIPLLLVSAENLLGITIDRYVELSDKDARVLFEAVGTLEIDVPSEVRVPAGGRNARLIFVDGLQDVTPEDLVDLLYTRGVDGDDIDLGSRHLAFWDAFFQSFDDPSDAAEVIEAAGAALSESDATTRDHSRFFSSLAQLPSEKLTITPLPVRPVSAGDSELYAVDAEELEQFITATVGAEAIAGEEIRVQVLNGNGVPGIGQEVADQLIPHGFRVILSGNARRLNYRDTLIIAYDTSEAGQALAARARRLLGVGKVQVSAQQQGIVDLTIVVGKDFVRAR